jgi:3-oxoacyl-[acyl-carrier-protein] synthase-1
MLEGGARCCIVAGVDSFLVGATLASLDGQSRLQTAQNSDGFIPGEAGAAVLLGRENTPGAELLCCGVGFGAEPAPIGSEEPLRAEGLAQAIRAAMADAGMSYDDVAYRITDVSGEQYAFKEAALALSRTMRVRKAEFDIWHPADCIGEVGAAIVPVVLGVALAAHSKGYAPGSGVLCHFSGPGRDRAALLLRAARTAGPSVPAGRGRRHGHG